MKSRDGKSQRKKRRRKKIKKEKAAEERRSRCAKREESPETLCFSNDLWKSRLAKASGAEPSGQMRDEKLHALVARMKKTKNYTSRSEHAVVARSTCRSQKCQKLRGTERFWTFRCRCAWQAQGILHLVKSEQHVRVLWQFPKRWPAWDI